MERLVGWRFRAITAAALLQGGSLALLVVQRLQRQRLEESLQESEERIALATLPKNLGVWRWNAKTGEFWATEYFRNILGLPVSQMLTRRAVLDRIHPDDRAGLGQLYVRAANDEVVESEFRIVTPDGDVRWIVSRARLSRGSDGEILYASGVILDVTDRQRAQAESEHQRAQLAHLTRVAILGELSGALAHELNQPLTSILSNAQAAQRFLATDPVNLTEVREILQDIVNDDKRAGEVIRRLRDMLRRGETRMQRLDLPQLMREALALAHSDLIVRHVEVNTKVDAALPCVPGDQVQIQQVILNLLLNASEAMAGNAARDRLIEISAAHEGRMVHVTVMDRGIGIAEGQLDKVFDAFYTTKSNGMGLGLAICRSIICAHGGRLWATNNEGAGSAFHFTLPALAATNLPAGAHP